VQVPLPWERLLWSGGSRRSLFQRSRYFLTDFRLVRLVGDDAHEVALHDITEISRTESNLERLLGTSTIVVGSGARPRELVLRGIRRGAQLAALLEILADQSRAVMEVDAVQASLEWEPRGTTTIGREAFAAVLVVAVAMLAVIGLHGKAVPLGFSPDDPIYPNGQKRSRAEIVRFMDRDVLPWARAALGPIKGGAERITCETCHGRDADARGWQMPAVGALPRPDFRREGWELYGGAMDAQMRNAIYGYLTDSEKQARAGYMRQVVMPGMARLLRRPAYDFTQPYAYNRSRQAFGCYHCHRVK